MVVSQGVHDTDFASHDADLHCNSAVPSDQPRALHFASVDPSVSRYFARS
jgi:hypothetical protein